MPYLMRYILESKAGCLPYPSQLDDRRYVNDDGEVKFQEIRQYFIRERVAEIDTKRQLLAQKSKQNLYKKKLPKHSQDESPSRERYDTSTERVGYEYSDAKKRKGPWRFRLEDGLEQLEDGSDSEERLLKLRRKDGDELSEHEEEEEAERLDDPDLYFGDKAKDLFWDFFKSDRKFKDFDYKGMQTDDPRQAYFDTCAELGVFPRAKLIIRDENNPEVEYTNVSLLKKSSQAVCQALARYQVPIEKVVFRNNGIKHEETMLLMDCLSRHFNNIRILCISRNKIGQEGTKFLAGAINQMKALTVLDLSHDEIGDVGIGQLVASMQENNILLEELDLSGNFIGKNTMYFN